MKNIVRCAGVAGLLTTVLVVGACSSSSKSSSSSTGGSGSSVGTSSASTASSGGGVERATAALKPFQTANPQIDLPALDSKPVAGKKLSWITCPLPTCAVLTEGLTAATTALGWTLKTVDGGITPESYLSALDTVVQSPGDAVLSASVLPVSAIGKELATLKAKNIPFISETNPTPVSGNYIANFLNAATFSTSGKVAADWTVSDSGGKAKAVYFQDPSYVQLQPIATAYKNELSAQCPGCSVDVQSVSVAGIGTKVPGQIVSYLQRNPATNYIVLFIGDATAGVPQAIQAAGLGSKVKIVTVLSGAGNLANISQGGESAAVSAEKTEVGWRMVDAAARFFANAPMACCAEPTGVIHLITKDNLPSDTSKPYTVPNYASYFMKAWKLSS